MKWTSVAEQNAIRKLWDYGHFRRPGDSYAESHNVEEHHLADLRLSDEPVKEAVTSYQEFFGDAIADRCIRHHNRALVNVDGDMGPATYEQLQQPRCGVPEFAGVEEANWPRDCRDRLTFAYEMRLSGLTSELMRKLLEEMAHIWSASLSDLSIKVIDELSRAHIWAKGRALPGGTLAWSHLARNSCTARLEQAYDTTITWAETLFLTTAAHEVGHAIGLPHNNDRNALMYPSINAASRQRRGWPNKTDLDQCRSIGYTVAANPSPNPPPTPPEPGPTDGKGVIVLGGLLYDLDVKRVVQ